MPTQRFASSVPAGGVIQNLMAGSQFEFMERPTRIQVYVTQDPADLGAAEIFFGQELELANSPVPVALNAGEGPIVPNDLVLDDIAAIRDRLVIRLNETGGALAALVRTLVVLTPL